jgi:hypothetical protein
MRADVDARRLREQLLEHDRDLRLQTGVAYATDRPDVTFIRDRR